MQLFCLQLEAFLLTMELFYLQLTILACLLTVGAFFAYNFSFFAYSWSFLAYSGKVRLIRALRDCKQRGSTVSKKAPTVSKKASPQILGASNWQVLGGNVILANSELTAMKRLQATT